MNIDIGKLKAMSTHCGADVVRLAAMIQNGHQVDGIVMVMALAYASVLVEAGTKIDEPTMETLRAHARAWANADRAAGATAQAKAAAEVAAQLRGEAPEATARTPTPAAPISAEREKELEEGVKKMLAEIAKKDGEKPAEEDDDDE